MKSDNLLKLYFDQLDQIHSAETQIREALPKMIEAATEPELKVALQNHLEQTTDHAVRLDKILMEAKGVVDPKPCKGIAALISEGEDIIQDATDDSVRDAGIVASAQKIEHYEMAAYGTLRTFAEILGNPEHADLLDQTLEEEKYADAILTSIADTANDKAHKVA